VTAGGFGQLLHRALRDRGPLCVGIDPHAALLAAWGLTDDVSGLERFSRTVVEALAGQVAVLKPQAAFFERHGARGVAVLEDVIAEARSAGALVLTDAKRGDIGSTMQAYADAYADPRSPLFSDAVTVSPYLGFGSLTPLLDTAERHGTGVFVLALTSNPEGAEVQHARTSSGRTVAGTVLEHVRRRNAVALPSPLGSVGCVVGATVGRTGEDMDIGGPLLAPGLGAQGAGPDDLREVFGPALRLVLPAVSREVLGSGPAGSALRGAAARLRDACALAMAG
jgi:orotidine-5'-phosphate decarboxylase